MSCIANHGFNKPPWIPATHYCGGVTLILKVVVRLSFPSLPVRRSSCPHAHPRSPPPPFRSSALRDLSISLCLGCSRVVGARMSCASEKVHSNPRPPDFIRIPAYTAAFGRRWWSTTVYEKRLLDFKVTD